MRFTGRGTSRRQISPSLYDCPLTGSRISTATPGSGRPIEPGLTGACGVLPINAVVSVCPNPSRMVSPQRFWTCAMTSGFSGSPAPTASRSAAGLSPRSA